MSSVIVAGIGMVLSFPLMVLTALAVRLSSPGPVLYRQVPVGLDDTLFTVYKFRSMRADAETGTRPVWAQKDDPRVTTLGPTTRRTPFHHRPPPITLPPPPPPH